MADDNVKVAVRMRPFNQREKDRNAGLCIRMVKETQSTLITDPASGVCSPAQPAVSCSCDGGPACERRHAVASRRCFSLEVLAIDPISMPSFPSAVMPRSAVVDPRVG
jgi:hypothetical protein